MCAKDPGKAELAGLWRTAIGLKKKVDNMNKVALILPWYGAKPWYWELFEKSAERLSMDVIVIAEKGFSVKAKNFRVVEMSLEEVRERAEKVLGTSVNLTRGYKLCDLRPMYGIVFADILDGYDYWAYGDCDVIYGRKFNDFLSKATTGDWDVATVQDKWLSGPFTMFKNVSKINTLFMRARDWQNMLKQPDNQIFDELGRDWFELYCFNGVALEELYKRDWTFGGVVWRAVDIRFLHEKVVIEDPLKQGYLHMRADGCLTLKDDEILMFHHLAVKNTPAFVGHRFSRRYDDEYLLTRYGYLPTGSGFLRVAVVAEHFVRGWSLFVWKMISGDRASRERMRRFIRCRLGMADWWQSVGS